MNAICQPQHQSKVRRTFFSYLTHMMYNVKFDHVQWFNEHYVSGSIFSLINKLVIGRKVDSFSQEVREHGE